MSSHNDQLAKNEFHFFASNVGFFFYYSFTSQASNLNEDLDREDKIFVDRDRKGAL